MTILTDTLTSYDFLSSFSHTTKTMENVFVNEGNNANSRVNKVE